MYSRRNPRKVWKEPIEVLRISLPVFLPVRYVLLEWMCANNSVFRQTPRGKCTAHLLDKNNCDKSLPKLYVVKFRVEFSDTGHGPDCPAVSRHPRVTPLPSSQTVEVGESIPESVMIAATGYNYAEQDTPQAERSLQITVESNP